jgi:hypothetical protein
MAGQRRDHAHEAEKKQTTREQKSQFEPLGTATPATKSYLAGWASPRRSQFAVFGG